MLWFYSITLLISYIPATPIFIQEEAQWAKAKLAETIVKLGQQQLNSSTSINNNTVLNATAQKTNDLVDRVESGSTETKMNTPDKVKKHNAGEHL